MVDRSSLIKAADYAFCRFEEVGEKIDRLSDSLRTFVIVYSAQGLIDNGGLEYFFASDFPGNPPYSLFVEAYREVGAVTAATIIDESLRFFALEKPEAQRALRVTYIESLPDDYSHDFSKLSTAICGDESVWDSLQRYAEERKAEFGLV